MKLLNAYLFYQQTYSNNFYMFLDNLLTTPELRVKTTKERSFLEITIQQKVSTQTGILSWFFSKK